ncbi:glycosyltransferase [Actinomycetospora chlora]
MGEIRGGAVMRVLHLNDDLEIGGVERVVLNLARQLESRGHVVGVLAADGGDLWVEVPMSAKQYRLAPREGVRGSLMWFMALRRIVRDDGWQVVHAHQRGLALLARLALVGRRVPVVEHVHSLFEATFVARLLSFRGQRLIACGSEVGAMLEGRFHRPRSRIAVIANAVPDPWESGRQRCAPSTKNSLNIVGIGRLAPEKDPVRFVQVVLSLRKMGYNCSAKWLGDGPLRDQVADFVSAMGADEFVEFPGSTSEVSREIENASLVLLTSRREGLPLTILEGMSLSRAVVTPDVGSCRDVVTDGETGILFDVSADADTIASRIAAAVRAGKLQALGEAGRRRFVADCSLDVMSQKVIDQYVLAIDAV